MLDDDVAIPGHTCEGLELFQERARGCMPDFQGGHIYGCDDSHYMPLLFCPFCGTKLDPHPSDCYECQRASWEDDREKILAH